MTYLNTFLTVASLLCAPSLAGDILVTATGVVTHDNYNFGPFNSIQHGDTVEVSFEVTLPPVVTNGGAVHDYFLDQPTFQVRSGGVMFSTTILGNPEFRVRNDSPVNDRVGLSNTLSNGHSILLNANLFPTTFITPNLSQLAGSYDISSLWINRVMEIRGSGGSGGAMSLLMEFREIAFKNLPTFQTFCSPNSNSSGSPCLLTPSVVTGNGSGVHMEASQGPPGSLAYLLVGDRAPTSGTLIDQGVLCLAPAPGNIGRYNVASTPLNSIGQFDAAGFLQNLVGTSMTGSGFDVPEAAPIAGFPVIMAGQSWHFQLWYRDLVSRSNFSSGVSVSFQ